MRSAGLISASSRGVIRRATGAAAAGAAVLISSCVVYTPDLLNDDAVSIGGGPSPTASPAPVLSAASLQPPTGATSSAGLALPSQPSSNAHTPLQRSRFAPEQLAALAEEAELGAESQADPRASDAGALWVDAGADADNPAAP